MLPISNTSKLVHYNYLSNENVNQESILQTYDESDILTRMVLYAKFFSDNPSPLSFYQLDLSNEVDRIVHFFREPSEGIEVHFGNDISTITGGMEFIRAFPMSRYKQNDTITNDRKPTRNLYRRDRTSRKQEFLRILKSIMKKDRKKR